LAEYWYNTSYHTALGLTPFEVLYGLPPWHLGILNPHDCSVPDLAAWMTDRNFLSHLIQQQLNRAQQRMKHQADTHRTEREFSVGDLVYLKPQPHIQTSVATRCTNKLSFRFFGPFKIIQCIGVVAYKLDFLESAQIHPVVHVSQLKRHVRTSVAVSTDLSSAATNSDEPAAPVMVIQHALKIIGGTVKPRILVQWDSPSSLQTWEDELDMRHRFPLSSAWGQAV